jgi:hypothetical protein
LNLGKVFRLDKSNTNAEGSTGVLPNVNKRWKGASKGKVSNIKESEAQKA